MSNLHDLDDKRVSEIADQNLRAVFDNAPLMIAFHNELGEFKYVSPSSLKVTGFKPTELEGKKLIDFLYPSRQEDKNMQKLFSSSRSNLSQVTQDYQFRCKDGRYKWLKATYVVPKDSGAEEALVFFQDQSELRRIDNALMTLSRANMTLHRDDFFRGLVSQVAAALQVKYAFVTENADDEQKRVRMLAYWTGDDFGNPEEYDLVNTPCDLVIREGKTCHYPLGIQGLFPKDEVLVTMGAQGYLGVPIYDSKRHIIGHLAILDNKVLTINDREIAIIRIFAEFAGMGLERFRLLSRKEDNMSSNLKV